MSKIVKQLLWGFFLILGLGFVGCEKTTEKDTDDENFNDGEKYTLTDVDGNTYDAISIGSQVWMAENLRVTHLNDMTALVKSTSNEDWDNNKTIPKYCWYDNDSVSYSKPYGALYNWHVVNTDKLCPDGWHVPSLNEWLKLKDYISGKGHEGKEGVALKAVSGWDAYEGVSGNGEDAFGFNALPAGMCAYLSTGNPTYGKGVSSKMWSSDSFNEASAHAFYLENSNSNLRQEYATWKVHGISVRCVKD
jgi:uncharacterized protein (TIGR02145 family)